MPENKTLSERFVEKFNALEFSSHASASDYTAWQRHVYIQTLKNAGVELPEITHVDDDDNENTPKKMSEGERMLPIFEYLPDDRRIDVLNYLDWLKMLEEEEDRIDMKFAENYDEQDDGETYSLAEVMKELGMAI